ncbi:MAG: thiol reductant ABC exporter subunit CydD [Spirochaetaceae bacterium]|nr:thiol reductant ABC exporter subunit CydD [Spirochaetaceae bacterium]
MFSKTLWKVQDKKALKCQGAVLALSLGSGACTAVQAFVVARIVNRIFFLQQNLASAYNLFILLVAIILLRGLFQWMEEHFALQVAGLVKHTLLDKLLEQVGVLGPGEMEHRQRGEFFTLLTQGLGTLDVYFCRYLPQLFKSALIPVAYLIVVFPFDWISGLIFLIATPLIPGFMMLIGKWSRKMAGSSWEAMARMGGYLQDVLTGLATLRNWNKEYHQEKKIRKVSDDFRLASMKTLRVAFLSALTLELFTTISIALVAVGLGIRLADGREVFEVALFIILLAPEYFQPLRQLGQRYHDSQNAILSADQMFDFLARVSSAKKTPEEKKTATTENCELSQNQPPQVVLNNLTFNWGEREVLKDIHLQLEPGEMYAIAGRSGAGKTTLLRILAGALTQKSGEYRVNGQDFQGWNHLAMIPAQPYFFHGSLLENITMGRNISLEQVQKVCRIIGAEDFILQLPQGYDTILGQEGIRLSGGQEQLVSIARAMVDENRNGLLLCDEATSSLDAQTESVVESALDKLYAGRTVLISAHRLHTLERAKKIFVLEEGKIVQQGSYQELSQDKNGAFARMLQEGLAV